MFPNSALVKSTGCFSGGNRTHRQNRWQAALRKMTSAHRNSTKSDQRRFLRSPRRRHRLGRPPPMKGNPGSIDVAKRLYHLFTAVVLANATLGRAADTTAPAAKPGDPAPKTDRVGFPTAYREKFQILRTKIEKDKQKVVTVFGNTAAASVTNLAQLPYPYGSVLVMETSSAARDNGGNLTLDDQGAMRPGVVSGLHVMRREKDFGKAYEAKRSGEWEYVEYKSDGSYITPPERSAACSACHIKAGEKKDLVYHGRFGE